MGKHLQVSGTPATGQVPVYNGANAAWATPAGGGATDATTLAKGIVQLAGDLGGTAALPTVPGLAAKATDSAVVHLAGAETVTGTKTFQAAQTTFVGNALIEDALTATKAYRMRTSGGALDFEAGGADMYLSTWSGANFTGTQYQQIQMSASGQPMAFSQGFYSAVGGATIGRSANYWSSIYGMRLYLNATAYLDGALAGTVAITGNVTATNLSGTNTGDQTNVTGTAGTITGNITESQVTNLTTDLAAKQPTLTLTTTGTTGAATLVGATLNIPSYAGGGGSGITRSIATVTTTVTLGATASTDYVTFIGASGLVTLPTAVGNTNQYTLKNVHTTNKTVATTLSQTIDGSTTITLTPNTSVDAASDGTNWRLI